MSLRKKLQYLDPFYYVDRFVLPPVKRLSEGSKLIVFIACAVFMLLAMNILVGFFNLAISFLIIIFMGYLYLSNKEEAIDWGIYLVSAFVFAWIIYAGLGFALGTPSPMVIVVSGSMEPNFYRGDVMVLLGTDAAGIKDKAIELNKDTLQMVPVSSFAELIYANKELKEIKFDNGETIPITKDGSVVVYFSQYRQQPIIHRTVAKLHASDGWYVLTKGDSVNNPTIDQDCGRVIYGRPDKDCITLYPVPVSELQGKAVFRIPFIGCIKLWVFDDLGSLLATGKLPEEFAGIC